MADNKFTLEDILAEYDNTSDNSKREPAENVTSKILDGIDISLDIYDDLEASADNTPESGNSFTVIPENDLPALPDAESLSDGDSLSGNIKNINSPAYPVSSQSTRYRLPPSKKEIFFQRLFLFKQLVKRDFKARYKRAALGVLWSMLSPMFVFAAQAVIFSVLFKRGANYVSFLVIGNVVYHYFTDSVTSGMFALAGNGGIISKINVPKSIFLLSKSVSCLLNFGLSMIIMFAICGIDGMKFHPLYFSLIIPILLMTVFNLGMGYVLSAWFVFFKDTQYLFSIFTTILMYFSCIFYSPERFPEAVQKLFYLNPVYCYIYYFRTVIMTNTMPSAKMHILCVFYAFTALFAGLSVYKKNNSKFVYYF